MKKTVPALSLAAVLLLTAGHLSAAPAGKNQRSPQSGATSQRRGANPLAEEMMVLDSAIREVVSAIAQAEGTRVTKALGTMNGAMRKTHQAIKAGAFSLPKNGDRLDEFQRRDESFHAQIEALDRAGQRNDIDAMLMITKQLIESCVSCHRMFWK